MQRFTVTAEHVTLLRNANVGWDDCEFGAPAIDCKRPYGNSYVFGDIGRLLGIQTPDNTGEFTEAEVARMQKRHHETAKAVQVFLATGEMKPGTYEADDYKRNWRLV